MFMSAVIQIAPNKELLTSDYNNLYYWSPTTHLMFPVESFFATCCILDLGSAKLQNQVGRERTYYNVACYQILSAGSQDDCITQKHPRSY